MKALKLKFDGQTGSTYINLDGKWERFWIYQLVRERVQENLNSVRYLDWFDLSQLLGDESWDYLASRGLLSRARYCFRYMIEKGLVPIRDVTQRSKDTKRYKVNSMSKLNATVFVGY